MIDIQRLNDNRWFLKGSRVKKVGTLEEVVKLAMDEEHMYMGDIEEGIIQMADNDHDTAHYGVNRTLIFTFDSKDTGVKNAS